MDREVGGAGYDDWRPGSGPGSQGGRHFVPVTSHPSIRSAPLLPWVVGPFGFYIPDGMVLA